VEIILSGCATIVVFNEAQNADGVYKLKNVLIVAVVPNLKTFG
jgi:hypothetical protein